MAIPAELEELSSRDPDGSKWRGCHREIIQGLAGGTTARQLLASESGALCLFDDAAGQIYTLPVPVAGMWFEFSVTVTRTSNSHSVDTDSSASFIGGGILIIGDGADESDAFAATIASTVSIDLDGATTGEQIGGQFTMTAISGTEWVCGGYAIGVGTLADPFA